MIVAASNMKLETYGNAKNKRKAQRNVEINAEWGSDK